MPIVRTEKDDNFTIISNTILYDNLRLESKGLLCFMLSKPDNWDYSLIMMSEELNLSLHKIRKLLKELEQKGYLKNERIREKGCFVSSKITVFEKPRVEKPRVVKPYVEKPRVVNLTKISTDIINNTELNNTKEKIYKKFDFKKSLLSYGFKKNLVDEWLLVRRNKRASQTETAYNRFIKEIERSDYDKNEVLKIMVENSWQGFKNEWIDKIKIQHSKEFKNSTDELKDILEKMNK